MAKLDDKIWLIKSNTKVLGPFSAQEVIKGLKKQDFYVLDEICYHLGRWHYIRDEQQFASVIREIQKNTPKTSDETMDLTSTVTETTDGGVDFMRFNNEEKLLQGVKQKVEEKIKVKKHGHGEDVPAVTIYDQQPKPEKSKLATHIKNIGLVLLIGTLVFLAYKKQTGNNVNVQINKAEDYLEESFQDFRMGHFKEALEKAETIVRKGTENKELLLTYAQLLLNEQRHVEATNVLEELTIKDTEKAYRPSVLNGLAVASMQAHDWTAAEKYVQECITLEPSNIDAKVNQSIILLYRNEAQKAYDMIRTEVIKPISEGKIKSFVDGAVLVVQVEAAMALYESANGISNINETLLQLDQFSKMSSYFQQETYILSAFLNHFLKRDEVAEDKIADAAQVDPEASQMFKPNLLIYQNRSDANYFLNWYKKMYREMKTVPSADALYALLLFKAHDHLVAVKEAEAAVMKMPNDPIVLSAAAYIMMKMGKEQDANLFAEKVLKLKNFAPALAVKARLCEGKKDFRCAVDAWNQIFKDHPQSMLARFQVVKNSYQLDSKDYNESEVKTMVEAYPNFAAGVQFLSKRNIK